MDPPQVLPTVDPATGERIYQIDPDGAYVLLVPGDVVIMPGVMEHIEAMWDKLRTRGGLMLLSGDCTIRLVARRAPEGPDGP